MSRQSFYDWCRDDEVFAAEIAAAEEALIDKAEQGLQLHIENFDLDAIKFYLKTKGRKRGYQENPVIAQQFNTYQGKPLSELSDEELQLLRDQQVKRLGA